MAHLSIRLLGSFLVTLDGEPVTTFEWDKVRGLLAYLAVEADQPHSREKLVGLLWPEMPEASARTNLRRALSDLRSAIADRSASPPYLHVSRQTIQFNRESDAWVDVHAFLDLASGGQMRGQTLPQLEDASALVRGELLEGFSLRDSLAFDEWLVVRREHLARLHLAALHRLAAYHWAEGDYETALRYAWQQVELDPYDEEACQQLMRLLALSGQRSAALAQYKALREMLREELGVEPALETAVLYEQIRNGTLPAEPAQRLAPLPAFLTGRTTPARPPVFVARETELTRLEGYLSAALSGRGQVVFVVGGPGQGKTALLHGFARRALDAHPDLLLAIGAGSAYAGIGDPYLPFREVLAMLSGEVEGRWAAGTVTTEQARRIWMALPRVSAILAERGSGLVGTLLSGRELLARVRAAASGRAGWLERIARLAERDAPAEGLEQSQLFEQYANVLLDLSDRHPLLIVLDDLQWADLASISLLFHLGRRLGGADSRLLIACAYRPEEVATDRADERHTLARVLSEFKRTFGDVWLDLGQVDRTEGRRFLDALLDAGPNRLAEGFRAALFQRTEGHPLYTVELLHAMQERGDLVQDKDGCWIEGSALDWEALPARVEAVLEERIDRLDPELQQALTIASVEGEVFTAQVVAQVRKMAERPLLHRLSQELQGWHRLVREQEEVQTEQGRISHYRFGHALFQDYVYKRLGQGERRLLHGEVAAALERLYAGRLDEVAVQLAHHFQQAGDDGHAFRYLTLAAERASRLYANDEAIAHYSRAIEVAEKASVDAASVIRLYLGRGLVGQTLGDFDGALADYESALQLADSAGEPAAERLKWRALIELGRLWTARDYDRAHDHFQRALGLASRLGDPKVLAGSLNWLGNWHLNAANPPAAIAHHQEALKIFEGVGDRRGLATTLDLLGIAILLGGDITAMVEYYDRAIPLFREMDDQVNLASSLTGRAHANCSAYTSLTLAPSTAPIQPRQDLEEAMRIVRAIGSSAGEAWVFWSVAQLNIVQGRYGQALEAARNGLDVAAQIGHREGMAASQCVLGTLYLELLAPEKARQQLEPALALAKELRSRIMIHWAIGVLAAVYCLRDDLTQAHTLLESALAAETPMDSMYKRYCWVRRAELALAQGDPALALDITERLIASAPDMSPGRVITFLWKLKGEALIALGEMEEAHPLLQAAVENARATGERFLLWRLHESLGRLYHAVDRQPEAEAEFSTARELMTELADTLPEGRMRDRFLQRAVLAK